VLTKAEYDIRASMQPRYHLEMALVRWIHLRRLVPITDLIQGIEKGAPQGARPAPAAPRAQAAQPLAAARPAPRPPAPATAARIAESRKEIPKATPASVPEAGPAVQPVAAGELKDAFLNEIRKAKKFFHGTVVAQAQRIDFEDDRIVFAFAPQHRALRLQLEQMRTWLETLADQLSGRKMAVVGVEGAPLAAVAKANETDAQASEKQAALREQALADSGVQAMLDVFAAEIRDVEEM
jgi:DNA polymerase-3 subunit gamma/tau